ncbi:MAG: teichoic acid biosynthesis protein [Myxococcales bacterium]|nr:teichoic acid biosynthesis protein [Myxococcales bacterium]
MGHAMRSSVVLEGLFAAGHDVRIVVSGRAADFLAARYPEGVIRITGLSLVYRDNMVSIVRSALQNLRSLSGLPRNFRRYLETAFDFHPDIVISDFESWTYWFARGQNVPVISVDNMQIISRCELDSGITGADRRSFLLAKAIVRGKLPKCNAYLITTFFYPPLKLTRTSLHPPILRESVLRRRDSISNGEHILVYQTGTSHDELVHELAASRVPCRVYGLRRDLKEDLLQDNLLYRPFSEERFLDDLASARAVILGGGFTLMGEALYLKKPMLSVPVRGQFEQILNARYLERLGYGTWTRNVTASDVMDLNAKAPLYRKALEDVEHDANVGFFRQLEESMVSAIAEGALPP